MSDVSNGAERQRKWPTHRGRNLHPKTKKQMEWFRQAQWATKFMDPKMMVTFAAATKDTPLLPRDLATMMFAGRFLNFTLADGRKLFSMQNMQDVSESLDAISQLVGATLIRGPIYWEGVAPITGNRVGAVLTRNTNLATVSDAAPIPVPWTAELVDQSSFWNIAAPNNIVIPFTGWYQFDLHCTRSNAGINFSETRFFINGVAQANQRYYLPNSYGVSIIAHSFSAYCQTGDIITVRVNSIGANANWNPLKFTIIGNA